MSLIFMACAAIIWVLAYKDIQLSSILMLLARRRLSRADSVSMLGRAVQA